MTPEERAVIEAAEKFRDKWSGFVDWEPTPATKGVLDAVDALRESRKPKAWYRVVPDPSSNHMFWLQGSRDGHGTGSLLGTFYERQDAERICRLLNEEGR